MPLFVCSNPDCRTVDNTAVSPASWSHIYGDGKPLCTACAGKSGWHHLFPRVTYDAAAEVGSAANPERLWLDGVWVNELPRRTGYWSNGQWYWNDEKSD